MIGFWWHRCHHHYLCNYYFITWLSYQVKNIQIPQSPFDFFFFKSSSNFSFVKATHSLLCNAASLLSTLATRTLFFSLISPWFLSSVHLLSTPSLFLFFFVTCHSEQNKTHIKNTGSQSLIFPRTHTYPPTDRHTSAADSIRACGNKGLQERT